MSNIISKNKIAKFLIKKGSFFLLLIICAISLLLSFFLEYTENEMLLHNNPNKIKQIVTIQTLKDITVIITSIIGVNLITTILIDINSRNKTLTDFFADDIISSPQFYEHLNDIEKEKLVNALLANYYFNNKSYIQEMHNSVLEKIQSLCEDGYYFTKCSFDVTCKVKDDYIEKHIEKTVHMRSFDKQKKLKKFCISHYGAQKNGIANEYEINSIKVNGNLITNEKLETSPHNTKPESRSLSTPEDIEYYTVLKEDLTLSNHRDTTIKTSYTTRTAPSDLVSTFKVSKPCKNFSVSFHMEHNHSNDYKLQSYAFGFADDAEELSHSSTHNEQTIIFNDWIFKNDGAVIVLVKK